LAGEGEEEAREGEKNKDNEPREQKYPTMYITAIEWEEVMNYNSLP